MAISTGIQSLRSWSGAVLHPPKYVQASLIVAAGGLLNGLDTGCIGPITVMPSFEASFGTLSSLMHGLVISSVLASAAVASGFSGLLSDSLGRTCAIGIGGLVFALGAALEAGAMSLVMLILGRLIVGVGEGLFISSLVVYVCEIAPPQKRGPLACTVQVLITVGLCLGYFMCYGTVRLESTVSWRLPLAIQSIIALFLGLACFFYIPESPRWLAFKGRKDEASAIWDRLGVSGAEREKDALQVAPSITQSEAIQPLQTSLDRMPKRIRPITSIKTIFKNGGGKPMILGTFIMCMQQLSGIDGVLYYAPLLFQQAGLTSAEASFLASGISAILICAATIPAFLLVDRWSRRASTIYGGLALFTCMITIGCLYASNSVHANYGAGRWVVIITIYVFAVSFCVSWALGVKLCASEIQPMATRATATSIAQSGSCITNFFVAFITPVLLSKSSSGVYFLFGGATLLTITVCAIFMPETRGRDLEQIAETFRQQSGSIRVMGDKFRKFTPRSLRALRRTRLAGIGPVGGTSAFEMGGPTAGTSA